MSAIPPPSIGSVLQSGIQQSEQARQTDADKNAQVDRARVTAGGADGILEVEETDADTQVNPDTGGQGSQGRHDAPPEEQVEALEQPSGITIDEDGNPHLDLSA
ncbi:MAG: hypothetical protein JXQ75_21480 [Phycisphaerae bacterium]|nr:hypothetical protein [Phycisphaerae bacterium]